jgi:hypothetical protein
MRAPIEGAMGAALIAAVGLACGGGGGDVRSAGALAAVSSAAHLRILWGTMQSTASEAQAALTQFTNVAGFLVMLSTPSERPATSSATQPVSFPDCVVHSGSGQAQTATLTDCSGTGVTVNGTLTRSGDTYRTDLTASYAISGYTGSVTFVGQVTATPTSLSGQLALSVNLNAYGQAYALSISATFSGITLCQNGIDPSGGTLTVSGQGNAAGVNINRSATATFGPGCGMVRISG